MKYSNIRTLVARSQQAVDDGQCDDVRPADTIREAKSFARYALTVDYQHSGEFSERMGYARVMACEDGSDVCVFDLVRPGYTQGYVPPYLRSSKPSNGEPCGQIETNTVCSLA